MFYFFYNWNLKVHLSNTTIKKLTTSILHHHAEFDHLCVI